MKDIPGFAWILGVSCSLAIFLFIFASMGPKNLPEAQIVWPIVENVKSEIEERRLTLVEGIRKEFTFQLYHVEVERLPNEKSPEEVGRYVVRVRFKVKNPKIRKIIGKGVDVGMIDLAPKSGRGSLRLVAQTLFEPEVEY
jgi:hypothetical protein